MSGWTEELHPRDPNGEFARGGNKDWARRIDSQISAGTIPDFMSLKKGDIITWRGQDYKVKTPSEISGTRRKPLIVEDSGGRERPIGHSAYTQFTTAHRSAGSSSEVSGADSAIKKSVEIQEPRASNVDADVNNAFQDQTARAPSVARRTTIKIYSNKELEDEQKSRGGKPIRGAAGIAWQDLRTRKTHIGLNRDLIGREHTQSQANSGWLIQSENHNHAVTTTAHEFGHAIDNNLSHNERIKVFNALAKALGIDAPDFSAALNSDKAHKAADDWVAKNKGFLAKEVSIYGSTNSRELLAELWTQYSLAKKTKPSRGAAAIGKVIDRIVGRK